MQILDNTLEEFVELFQGSTTYFGASKPLGQTRGRDGKQEFKHWVEPKPMTREHWLQHLKGEAYYGSVPIRDDNTCNWGVIDVDRYNIQHKEIISIIRKRKYPLIPFRSKSNGLHLVLFIDGVVPASSMRKKLIELASDLGVNDSTTDIYPAQDEVDLTPEDWNKKRKGNFVNLPYQKAHMTTRVCMDNDGNSIKLENLYKFVSEYRLNPKEFHKLKIFQDDETKDYPPCVVNFMKNKVQKGEGRNDAMFNVAVLAKKINPDPVMYEDWTRNLMTKVCSEPLHPQELNNMIEDQRFKEIAESFEREVLSRWDSEAIRKNVIATQKQRRGIHAAMEAGISQSWDYNPPRDASNEFVRNHMDWLVAKETKGYPPHQRSNKK